MTNPICPYCGEPMDMAALRRISDSEVEEVMLCSFCESLTNPDEMEPEEDEDEYYSRQDYDDLLDNLANWDEEPPEEYET